MRINTNVASLNALGNLARTSKAQNSSMAKLSSGFRINRAGDDAAGLGIANKLRADLRSMKAASRNAEQATAMLQIAEGATQTVANILDRMKELATQAGSDNVDTAGRTRIKAEWDELVVEIDKIADTTKFQGKELLNGGFGKSLHADSTVLDGYHSAVTINGAAAGSYTLTNGASNVMTLTNGAITQTIGAASDGVQTLEFSAFGLSLTTTSSFDADGTDALNGGNITVSAGSGGGAFLVRSSGDYDGDDLVDLDAIDLQSATLNIDAGAGGITLTGEGTAGEWQDAITGIDNAIASVNSAFGTLGAAQNRIDYAISNLRTSIENYSAAESTIRDVDMAAEMTELSKFQILQQAGTAMLAQTNQLGQGVLQLLRG